MASQIQIENFIGELTEDETREVLHQCIMALPNDVLIEALSEELSQDQIEELSIAE